MLSLTIAVSRMMASRREAGMRGMVLGAIRNHLNDPFNGLAACRGSFAQLPSVKDVQLAPESAWTPLYSGPGLEVLLLPRPTINLSGWTSYLDSDLRDEDETTWEVARLKPGEELMLLLEADESSDVDAFITGHQQWWSEQEDVVKLESLCRRVAWRVGPPFSILLACSLLDLERLIDAYLSDLLVTDDPLNINQILVVQAEGHPAQLLQSPSAASKTDPSSADDRQRPSSTASLPRRFRPPHGPTKPPNIVVFDANGQDRAPAIITELQAVLDPECYTFHALAISDWRTGCWQNTATLLVCLCDCPGSRKELEAVQEAISRFTLKFRADAVLLLPSEEEMAENELENVEEGWTKVESGGDTGGRFLCLRESACLTETSRVRTLLASLDLRLRASQPINEEDPRKDDLCPAPVLLCTSNDVTHDCVREVVAAFSNSRHLRLDPSPHPEPEHHHLLSWSHQEAAGRSAFNFRLFREDLEQCPVPITLLHADVLSSSWTIMEGVFGRLKPNSGLVLSSFSQTVGKGRGQNAWISPIGQLQMTFHCSAHVSSPLGQCPSLVQHLAALTVVLAIEDSLPGKAKDVGLRVKWPNDIYWCRSESESIKLGGLLCKASITGLDFHFLVGIGVNVSNEKPTTCLHQILLENGYVEKDLPSIELLMRNLLLRFFRTKVDLDMGRISMADLRSLYESRWMHSGQMVTMTQADGSHSTNCRILGIDSYGYLLVQETEGSQTFSLHPDGNSFDLFANLIRPK